MTVIFGSVLSLFSDILTALWGYALFRLILSALLALVIFSLVQASGHAVRRG